MSEATNMTDQQRLEIFKDEYRSIIRKYEREVEKYAIKMNEDYEDFFRWYGGAMYKAQINLKVIRDLRCLTSWDSIDKVKMALENHINNIELTLIEGSQYPTSTNLLHNVAEILGREASQGLRADFQRLLNVITDK